MKNYKRRDKDSGKSSMHQATCDNCGKECEVPFKPTRGKPIFCSNCFEKNQHEDPGRFGKERRVRKSRSGDSRKRNFDDRNPEMHNAVCDNCGENCEVPFKPTSGKPIFCSNCFEKNQHEDPRRFGKERRVRKSKSGDSRKRNFDDRNPEMHNAVCDNCGEDCEVPFRPTKGIPIYCDKCFKNNKEKDIDQLKKEFGILNKKLDEILEILTPVLSVKNHQEELEEKTEVPKIKKKTKKKVVTKKEVKKKV